MLPWYIYFIIYLTTTGTLLYMTMRRKQSKLSAFDVAAIIGNDLVVQNEKNEDEEHMKQLFTKARAHEAALQIAWPLSS